MAGRERHGGHEHGQHEPHAHDQPHGHAHGHAHPPHEDCGPPLEGEVTATFVLARAAVEEQAAEHDVAEADVVATVFDDEGEHVGDFRLGREGGRANLPTRLEGTVLTVGFAPPNPTGRRPKLDELLDRGAPVVRVPFDAGQRPIEIERPQIDPRLFKTSCCRVRGRVIRRIQLPNGRTIERPLCNARVVICEVDVKPRRVVATLPDDLIVRLATELPEFVPPRPLPDPPPFRLAEPVAQPAAGLDDGGHVHHRHGPAGHVDVTTAAPTVPLPQPVPLTTALAPTALRAALLERVDLLKRFWCRFPWLHERYDVDCVATAPLDADGRFDTDIRYWCYGDRPDLYFKVEQRCDGDWETVHAPSVACATHWDYCCGDEVEIVVTNPRAGLAAARPPYVHVDVPGDPASVGQWQLLPYTSQVFVVHAALLRTGKVLLFSGGVEGQQPLESRLWDPATGSFATHTFADDLFCAFQVALGDGRVLVMGGSNYHGPHGRGIFATYTFDPASPGWTKHADMAFGRWYPTAVTLPDGRVVVMSGNSAGGGVVNEAEVFDPSGNTWSTLPGSASKQLDIYPSLHLMADGKVFYTGTRWAGGFTSPRPWTPPPTAVFDPGTNVWTDVGPHVIPNRTEGTSVLLPPRASAAHEHGHGEDMPPPGTLTRVLVLGGDCGSPAERVSAEVIDLADPAPAWHRIADMHHRRVNPNAVLLPDGTVLVCAGIAGFKWDGDPGRVLEAEIFDPQAMTWKRAAAMTDGRQYHSVSVLLPDGRVLNTGSVGGVGGQQNLTSMEVYSPPYLFRGPRPRVTGYPASTTWGEAITVTSPDACRIRRAAFVRPGAPTHHTDSEQRYVPLGFHREGACGIYLEVPDSPALLPPGYYMLFLLDDCGVPSEAKFVRVG